MIITVTLNPALDKTLEVQGFAKGKLNRVENISTAPGGKGINVSIKLKEEDPLTIGYITRKGSELSMYGKLYVEEILKFKEL